MTKPNWTPGPNDIYTVLELSKNAYYQLESIIDPKKRFCYGDFPKANFIVGELLFTYMSDYSQALNPPTEGK